MIVRYLHVVLGHEPGHTAVLLRLHQKPAFIRIERQKRLVLLYAQLSRSTGIVVIDGLNS